MFAFPTWALLDVVKREIHLKVALKPFVRLSLVCSL